MTKLVKWIDKDGEIKTTEYGDNDDISGMNNVIEISTLSSVWTIDKPVYKVTYDYDEFSLNPVTEFYTTNDIIVAIAANAYDYDIGNYIYENLVRDYGYDPDDYDPMRLMRKLNKTGYANFISVYDHSGHTYFLGRSRGWDVSCIGIIYVPYSTTSNGEQFAIDVLNDVNAWVNGNCYQVMIEQLNNGEFECINSCCGYYSKEHVITDTENEISGITKNNTDPLIITIDNTY